MRAKSLRAVLVSLACLPAFALAAHRETYTGMVWETYGNWYLNGSSTPIRLGDAVPPGALLTADAKDGAESTVVLLPDGQRVLCECNNAMVCDQGFRVPALTAPPASSTWEMFLGVRSALLLRPATAHAPFPPVEGRPTFAANLEIVAPLIRPGEFSMAPALSELPAGRYKLVVTDDADPFSTPSAVHQPLVWTGPKGKAYVHVPGAGVYRIRVADASLALRMQVEVLVTTADAFAGESKGLKQARASVRLWSSAYKGWAPHDFLRAYLASRTLPAR